ncbi:MAG: hypothetical protein WCL16_10350 [bacterium]
MYSGCGAGGAIWINCLTLAGNNGVINADGGTGAGFALQAAGGGGGGRIAMLYGSLSGTPNVQLSAAAGLGAYVFYTSLAGFESAMGSVYLPDTNLLSSTINNLAGRLVISNTAAWTTPNLTVTNTMLGFDDNFALNVTGDLVVGGSNTVLLTGSNSQTTVGGAVRLQNAGQLQLQGNLTAGGSVSLESGTNILAARGNLLVNCGGNFTVTNGGAVYLMSGKTNGLGRSYGLLMSVTGDVNIAAASWVYPYSHYSDGGSCRLTMNNLTIPPNAGFNADSKGFNGVWNGSGYGPGAGTYTGGGAGYGGKGGNTSLGGAAGNPYGSTNAPIQPGSGGGAHPNATAPSPGGGEVWIEAAGNVQLDGTITANGQSGYYSPTDMRSGCGSGGGIFILCSGLSGGASGVLSANGGSGTNFTGRSGGGGGGGRISVGIGFSADNKAKLLAGTSITGLIAYAQEPVFTGTLSVTSGIGYTNLPPGGAASGSKQFMRILGASDCALTITGDPAQYGAPDTNGYATWVTAPGTVFTNTVISPASELNGQRWSCIGWRVNTNAGGLIASGTTTQAVFTVSTNVTLTWLWTNQYQLAVSAAGTYGSVNSGVVNGFYTNGTVVTGIQATPTNAGAYFVAWVGASVPAGQATANPLSVTMDRVRTNLTATFSLTAGEPKTWTGVGNWTSYTNWSPQGMPGSNDNAVLQSGTSTISEAYSIGSLVVSNGAALIFTNWSTCLTASNVTIRNQGLMTLPASFGTNEMSNRVYVLAHNFTVDTGGIVNADSKGYKTGQGPGKGISNGSNLNTGGGHGGKGGRNSSCSGGETNDVPEAPVFPGSGGGDYTDDGDTGMGGGAVRIAATNVVVNGTISADGASGGTYDGGGAGGSIFITCATLGGGTSGVLQARGGYGGSGYPADTSGGGGRIAVIYSTLSGNAGVHFSAAAGSKNTYPGGMGTLYLPNTNLVQQPFNNFQGVRLVINGFNSWNSDSLLVSNSVVSFGDGDFTLSVTNNLTVWSNSWLALGGVALSGTQSLQAVTATATNPVVNVGGNLYLTGGGLTLGGAGQLSHIAMNIGSNVIATGGGILRLGGAAQILTATINVASNLTLNRGILQLGGLASFSNNTLNVGGDLILTNGAELWIYSGPSNTSVNSYGASVSITGMTYITSNSWIYPYAHPTNGGAPYFQLSKDLIISSNAGFNANGAGYQAGYGPGKGVSDSSTSCSGGGYGGRGGNSSTKNGGISNGVAHAPVGPGSGGGYYDALGYGGGAIRIDAKRITLGGVLTANGNVTTYNGGGSGGSIFLVCDSFLGGNSAFLCATGGPQANTALKSGGGGGGRIAVWVGLSETQKAQVWAGNLSRLTVAGTNQYFTGAFSVTNGLDYTNPPTGGAAVGTIVFITSPPVRGTMIMMR